VALQNLAGSQIIERFMASWSVVLYGAYLALFLWCLSRFSGETLTAFSASSVGTGWGKAGVRYAAYNIALIPPLLFSVRHLTTRRETFLAGLLSGPVAMIPGFLFFMAMVGHFPAILQRPVPANFLLETLGSRPFQILFQIVLFGTLVETGIGLIHGMNERISHVFRERNGEMPPLLRTLSALLFLGAGTLLAGVGLVDLIARGYGTLTWVFLGVYVIPVLTLGVWKLRVMSNRQAL
jgi:uncharacterized membrane protein YkvI